MHNILPNFGPGPLQELALYHLRIAPVIFNQEDHGRGPSIRCPHRSLILREIVNRK